MKKIFFLICALLISFPIMAQKFLDVYQKGTVTKSIPTSTIDSVSLSGSNMQDRKVNFYRDGQVINSYYVSTVDSIKVYRFEDDPFVYLGIIGFNQELFEKPIDILSNSTSYIYRSYVKNLKTKDGTLLYYAVDKAIDKLKQYDFNTPISNVAIVTFTDGIDQGSLMMTDYYSTNQQYLNALQWRIGNTKVEGLPLKAYSVGLRGSDVSDYNQFQTNLQRLASSSDKAFEVYSINDVNTRLKEISDRIISISNKQTFSMKIPGQSNGTLIRFTFDGNAPESSTMYIEGRFNLADRSLRNVTYHGIKSIGNNYIQGTQDGIFVTFTFTDLQREDENGLIPTNNIRQYARAANSASWQHNSEFSPNNNTLTTITHSGAAIMLVLDCSNSMGNKFSNLKEYAQSFINQLANNAASFYVSTPTNVKAEMNDEDFTIRVSWDAAKHAESYDVYRSNNSSSGFIKVAGGLTSTSWVDEKPLSGNNYYQISAFGHGLYGSDSKVSNVIDYHLEEPSNVTGNLQIANNRLMIRITWDESPHAESYNIYRNNKPYSNFTQIASNVSSLSWVDTNPLSGINYYKVEAQGRGTYSMLSKASNEVVYGIDAPQNATASLDNTKFVINVKWDAAKLAESYKVYRSNGGSFSLVEKDILGTTWTDETPLAGNNYYKVYAVGYGLTSEASETTNNVIYKLEAPQNVSATMEDDRFVIRVRWDEVKYAESYEVYRSNSSSSGFTKVTEGVTSTSWVDETPLSGNNYYRVYAISRGITSTVSNTSSVVSYALDAPSNVSASLDDNDFVVKVLWDTVKHAESYDVYRSSSSSGDFTKVARGVTSTSWIDNNPLSGNNFYYICAVGHGLTSSRSETSNAVNYALDAPTNVSASLDDDDFVINVSWDAVKHAESYEVYRSKSSLSGFTKVAERVTSLCWIDEEPLSGNNYYRVIAVGHGLTSSYSNTSNVTNVNYALDKPTNVVATKLDESIGIKVSWDVVKRAESYDVYRSSNTYSSNFTLVASGLTTSSWVDDKPLSGSNYYRVCAVGHGFTSAFSNTTSMIDCFLDAPKNVTATMEKTNDKFVVNVSWDTVKYAERYKVYAIHDGIQKLVGTVTSTSFTDQQPPIGIISYHVVAFGHDLKSDMSKPSNMIYNLRQTISLKGISFNMIKVESGTFLMGGTPEQGRDASDNEYPVHQVTLSDYYIGETEVTQELWQAVMGNNPVMKTKNSLWINSKFPVFYCGWNGCQEFIRKLNQLTGKNFRLPTEAEWEFAARGGNLSNGYKYSGSNSLRDISWWVENHGKNQFNLAPHETATKAPNELGIYDMSGNVGEYCNDWYGQYNSYNQKNPTGPTSGDFHVCRGGNFFWSHLEALEGRDLRVSFRYSFNYDSEQPMGLRLALTSP